MLNSLVEFIENQTKTRQSGLADLTQYFGLEHRVEDFHVGLDENKC